MRIVALIPQQGGPRIAKNQIFFDKPKKSSKTQELKKIQRYANINDIPFDQRSLIHREAWFGPCFVRQNQPNFFCFLFGDFRPLPNKNIQILDNFPTKMFKSQTTFSISFSQGFQISKNIGHPTWGSGGKKTVKRYLKSEHTHKHTKTQTDTHMDILTYRKHRPRGPMV